MINNPWIHKHGTMFGLRNKTADDCRACRWDEGKEAAKPGRDRLIELVASILRRHLDIPGKVGTPNTIADAILAEFWPNP